MESSKTALTLIVFFSVSNCLGTTVSIISQSGGFGTPVIVDNQVTFPDFWYNGPHALAFFQQDEDSADILLSISPPGMWKVDYALGSWGNIYSFSTFNNVIDEFTPTGYRWDRSVNVDVVDTLRIHIYVKAMPNIPPDFYSSIGWHTLILTPPSDIPVLEGDFNFDGAVDAADYTVWRNEGRSNEDYVLWKQNFGAINHPLNQNQVPESTLVLVITAIICVRMRKR